MPIESTGGDERAGRRQNAAALLFMGVALVVMHLPSGVQQEISSALRSSVLRPFLLTQELLVQTRIRAGEMELLQARNDSLVALLTRRRILAEENRRLRELLDLSERAGPGFRAANVLRSGTTGSESMFLLDIGRRQGVRVHAPVLVREGLVGLVREVGTGTSVAMDWTHPDFRVSAMTADGRNFGIVEPRRGNFREQDRLLLRAIPFHSSLEPGTGVVSSGRGGVYPRGVPVGEVEELAEAEAGWRRSYWLRPAVEPGRVTHALVVVPVEGAAAEDLSDLFDGTVHQEDPLAREDGETGAGSEEDGEGDP